MTAALRRRLLFWAPGAAMLLLALVWLLRPQPIPVDLAPVERGPLQVMLSEEGETRVRDVFVVSAPAPGLMRRIALEAGDHVVANETVIAQLEPTAPLFLDERAAAEARAAADAAAAALAYAQANLRRMEAERDFAQSELERLRALAARQTISQSDLDSAERRSKTASAAVAEARAAVRMRESELRQARARLLNPAQAKRAEECDCIMIYSPISGAVLRVLQKSEAVVNAGAPILEIGDRRDLEIHVALLSQEAIRVRPGQRALIERWGGPGALNGVVRRVEPYGYTKISALGVEEQRVNVILHITDPYERWRRLGHGYRVEPRIVVWESHDVLQAPLSALFREGNEWAVFVEERGRARLRTVEIGQSNDVQAQIKRGLEAGERIVLHPNERIVAGARIVDRAAD
ncbi:MAG: HlyD family efflux transporter periplasmic adaptor subunit [Steroidobacteraceae bacterium]|jgi:HlyD family secretion protein|nr:HlyD family efflux transporter periplasmic adaptor subunit [Steroidobacteraceae bacterium]